MFFLPVLDLCCLRTLQTIELQKDDTIYTLTDGFPDQFGGTNGKKFMSKKSYPNNG